MDQAVSVGSARRRHRDRFHSSDRRRTEEGSIHCRATVRVVRQATSAREPRVSRFRKRQRSSERPAVTAIAIDSRLVVWAYQDVDRNVSRIRDSLGRQFATARQPRQCDRLVASVVAFPSNGRMLKTPESLRTSGPVSIMRCFQPFWFPRHVICTITKYALRERHFDVSAPHL